MPGHHLLRQMLFTLDNIYISIFKFFPGCLVLIHVCQQYELFEFKFALCISSYQMESNIKISGCSNIFWSEADIAPETMLVHTSTLYSTKLVVNLWPSLTCGIHRTVNTYDFTVISFIIAIFFFQAFGRSSVLTKCEEVLRQGHIICVRANLGFQ